MNTRQFKAYINNAPIALSATGNKYEWAWRVARVKNDINKGNTFVIEVSYRGFTVSDTLYYATGWPMRNDIVTMIRNLAQLLSELGETKRRK